MDDIGEKRAGRPTKGEGPKLDYNELDRILVMGEYEDSSDGRSQVRFPTYRELGKRYGVTHSIIAEYAKAHDCRRRRQRARERIMAKTEEKMIEMRAQSLAYSKEDAVNTIDGYLLKFHEAVAEGRVRVDNPTDFDRMLRLKEFIMGGADSRHEVHASLSLEGLQLRHRDMLKVLEASSDTEQGVISRPGPCDLKTIAAVESREIVDVQPGAVAPDQAEDEVDDLDELDDCDEANESDDSDELDELDDSDGDEGDPGENES